MRRTDDQFRGIGSFAVKMFKWLNSGGKAVTWATNAAGLVHGIFRAGGGCCVDFPEGCEYHKQYLQKKEEINEKSKKADRMQLDANVSEIWITAGIKQFELISDQMERIGNEQDKFINALSPKLETILAVEKARIEGLIKEKIATLKGVEYVQAVDLFASAIDQTINVGVPLLGILMPAGEKFYEYSKERLASQKTQELERRAAIRFKHPPRTNEARLRRTQLRRIVGSVRLTRARFEKVKAGQMSTRTKIWRLGKKMANGFMSSFNYLTAGFTVYSFIKERNTCRDNVAKMKQAVQNLTKALDSINDGIDNITKAQEAIEETFDFLRGNLTEENFNSIIQNTKKMVAEVNQEANDDEMVTVAVDIQDFIDKMNGNPTKEDTYNLENKLFKALRRIPFTYKCFTAKASMMQEVIKGCREGIANYSKLYTDATVSPKFNLSTDCDAKLGVKFVDRTVLEEGLKEAAKKEQFNPVCLMNNPLLKTTVCGYHDDGFKPKTIVMKLQELDKVLKKKYVKQIIKKCPPPKVTPRKKNQVCMSLKWGGSPAEIAEAFDLDVQTVQSIKCP